MRAIIKRGIVASLVLVGILVASHLAGAPAEPPATVSAAAPARADLAEAVYAMVAARAAEAGLPQPVTLCQACLAAHLGLPERHRAAARLSAGLRPGRPSLQRTTIGQRKRKRPPAAGGMMPRTPRMGTGGLGGMIPPAGPGQRPGRRRRIPYAGWAQRISPREWESSSRGWWGRMRTVKPNRPASLGLISPA